MFKLRFIALASMGLIASTEVLAAGSSWDCSNRVASEAWSCSGQNGAAVGAKDGVASELIPKDPSQPSVAFPKSEQIAEIDKSKLSSQLKSKPLSVADASPAGTPPLPIPDRLNEEPTGRINSATLTPIEGVAERKKRLGSHRPQGIATRALKNRMDMLDEGISWERCGPKLDSRLLYSPHLLTSGDEDLYLSSDAGEFNRNDDTAIFVGGVEATRGEQYIEADWAQYDRKSDKMSAKGDVYYETPGLRFVADEASFNIKQKNGIARGIKGYRLPDAGARGEAASAEILDKDRSRYTGTTYTTCKPGNSDWYIQADKLDIDQASGWAEGQNATVRFKGVPIFYSPYFTFPVDDRRMSGFLRPKLASSNETGLDITAPYYLNLAPNYDMTLYPRIMSKRGIMLGGEFRFLTDTSSVSEGHIANSISAEVLPDDWSDSSGNEGTRGAFSVRYQDNPAPRWSTQVYVDYASDSDYVQEFGTNIGVTSAVHLERRAEASYSGDFWSMTTRVQNYQTIDETLAKANRPYSRLPQLLFKAKMPDEQTGLVYHMLGEYVNFDRDGTVQGQRLDLMPGVSYPIRRPWGHLVPKLSTRYTAYQLEEQDVGKPENPDRLLPIFSLDSGLVFERPISWFGESATQTLEPRLFYLYTPQENQDDLPVFDTAQYGLGFNTLFRENRFSGADRQGDANQITTALTSRILSDETGEEWLTASVGQITYFEDRNVQLPGIAVNQDNSSSLVAEVEARLTQDLYSRVFLQYDPDAGDVEKGAAEMRYKDEDSRIFNLAYRYEDGIQEQVDTSFSWPVVGNWNMVGRWAYSLLDEKSIDRFGGVEYKSCCWAFRFVGRHFVNEETTTSGVFLELELAGLGAIGNQAKREIEDGVLGYKASK